ncbi:MAG: transglycosylase SLT domain-containing protein [Muribaculaceae bacterium]|nr:transglycosylase SLT domain-containing protein [Muribaculaceae bacterium]
MKNRILLLAAAAALLLAPAGFAQKKKGNVLDVKTSVQDNDLVFPASFETNTQDLLDGWYMKNYTATDSRYKTTQDPNPSDAVIIERLSNMGTVIDMPYNSIVRKCIDRYAKNGRSLVTACLGLGNYYIPIIEQALEAEGLPNELKYLPMIESAYNPNAVSPAGATGLWQFMLVAAKGYDMEVSSLVDERRDPYESSRKAAKMLKDLYNTYGRWDLAIAAYNCGPGNVNKALRRAGGDSSTLDFWSIYNYLPRETRGYFPTFVAANYIMNYYPDHNISPVVPTKPLVTDTVAVHQRVNLNQISKVMNIPLDELRLLNPQYRSDIIPGSAKRPYMLILPQQQISAYIMNEDAIRGYDAAKYAQRQTAEPGQKPGELVAVTETAAAGGDIVSEEDLYVAQEAVPAEANEDYRMVRDSARKRGRENPDDEPAREGHVRARSTYVNNAGQTIHKVAEGDDLASIAGKYKVTQEQLKIWNNLPRNSVRVGQELIVSKGAGTTPASRQEQRQQQQAQRQQHHAAAATEDMETAQPAQPAKPARQNSRRTQQQQKPATQPDRQTPSRQRAQQKAQEQAQQAQQPAQQKTGKKSRRQQKAEQQAQQQAAQQKSTKKTRKQRQAEQQQQQQATQQNTKNGKKKSRKNNKQQAQQQPPKPQTHEVRKGESLERIAKQNGVSVDELRKANKNIKGDRINPGDKVNIPSKKAGKQSKQQQAQQTKQSKQQGKQSKQTKKADAKKGSKQTGAKKTDSKQTGKKQTSKKKK